MDEQPPNAGLDTHLQPQDRGEDVQEPHRDNNTAKTEPTAESLLISEESTAAHSASLRHDRTTFALWAQEFFAAFLLCAAVIASYATLVPYHGKSLPEWPRAITISALLSTYSVVLRLAASFLLAEGLAQLKWRWFNRSGGAPLHDLVLHDSATRGPIGSLLLLWRLPTPVTWQWLGCALVILALAIGPLTQLVLQYEQCPVPMDVPDRDASIPRATVFFGQGMHSGAAINTLTLAEQISINAGIYDIGSVRTECASGNCTFAPYTSVGYCGECSDISAGMRFALLSNEGISSYIPGGLSTNYTPGITSGTNNYAAGGNAGAAGDGYMIVIGPPNTQQQGALSDCSNNRTWACQGYAAAICGLSPCIRNYTAGMTNGVFQESVVNTWKDIFSDAQLPLGNGFAYASINKSCLTVEQSSQLHAVGYKLDDNGPWLAYNGSVVANKTNPSIDLRPMEQDLLERQCLFAVDLFFNNGLYFYLLSGAFTGNVTAEIDSYGHITAFEGPQLLLTVYNNEDISFERTQGVFENLSLSLTNYMRVNPYSSGYSGNYTPSHPNYRFNLNNTNLPAPGLAYTTKTCLQVRWGWLVFPTALAALTLVFFTGVILSSGSLTNDVRTWKSSPLPLLFYGSSISEALPFSQHVSDLNSVAKRTRVSLAKDEEGNLVLRRQGGTAGRYEEI